MRKGGKGERESKNDVKCINVVKEEMAEDFSLRNVTLRDGEQFGQLHERDKRD